VPLGRVVHAQVVADLAHHHLAGVHADAGAEVEPVPDADLVGIASQLAPQSQRRVADPLGVVHRSLDVGEEHRHLLALSLEGGLGAEDLLGEVLRRLVARGALRGSASHGSSEALPTAVAEGERELARRESGMEK